MSFSSGKAGKFKLDNAAGSLIDLSPFINSVDFPQDAQLLETTTLGAGSRTYITGFKNATFALRGHWDGSSAAIDEHLSAILGHANTQTFEYGPEGGTGGMVKYTGECRLTKYSCMTPVDGVVDWSADVQVTGAVSRTTW